MKHFVCMNILFPQPLPLGGHIRVVAFSTSLGVVPVDAREHAEHQFAKRGYRLSFGKHVMKQDVFRSTSVRERLQDFEVALRDPDVDLILAARGGFNVNQLFPHLDWNLIRRARKPIAGHSDITGLVNAIFARTGLVTYLAPNFSTLGAKLGNAYTWEFLFRALEQPESFVIESSARWSDDDWQHDQTHRRFYKNRGPVVLQPGHATGQSIGGNLCTFGLLQGTPWMPSLAGAIIFLEDDALTGTWTPQEFDRHLESLLQQKGSDKIQGLVLGRFQKKSEMTHEKLLAMIRAKPSLKSLPVVANVDFGHTSPQCTIPIGATADLRATNKAVSISFRQR